MLPHSSLCCGSDISNFPELTLAHSPLCCGMLTQSLESYFYYLFGRVRSGVVSLCWGCYLISPCAVACWLSLWSLIFIIYLVVLGQVLSSCAGDVTSFPPPPCAVACWLSLWSLIFIYYLFGHVEVRCCLPVLGVLPHSPLCCGMLTQSLESDMTTGSSF